VSPALAAHMRLMHSIPKERIRTHEQNNRYLPKRYNAPTPQWKIEEMVRMKKEGKSGSEIATELMVCEQTVWTHLKKHGLLKSQNRGDHPGAGGRKVKWGSKTYDTIKECAKAVGLFTHAVRRKLGLKKDGRKRHDAGAIRERDCPTINGRKWRPEEVVKCAGYEIPVFSELLPGGNK
jgi:hypothetical protein